MGEKLRQPMPDHITDLNLVIQHVVALANQQALSAWGSYNARQRSIYATPATIVGMKLDLTWNPAVSNTHSCPHNGVSNWGGRDKKAPTGYPGWRGRIWIRAAAECPGFLSHYLDRSGIHLGSGGYGVYDGPARTIMTVYNSHIAHLNSEHHRARTRHHRNQILLELARIRAMEPKSYSYDCELYDADWPGLSNTKAIEYAQRYLETGTKPEKTTITASWVDPEFAKRDTEFIRMTKQCAGCNPGTAVKFIDLTQEIDFLN
jgi:hypothetical protein